MFYRFEGRHRRVTLGEYPAMGLADARVKLAEARKALESGVDPGTVKVKQQKAERVAETVADLVEAYLDKWARPRKRSAAEDERILRKDVIPACLAENCAVAAYDFIDINSFDVRISSGLFVCNFFS